MIKLKTKTKTKTKNETKTIIIIIIIIIIEIKKIINLIWRIKLKIIKTLTKEQMKQIKNQKKRN
jgi:hypothetical protein